MEKNIVGWADIQLSEQGQKALLDLQPGKVMAVAVKHVNDTAGYNKYQIEFAEKINNPDRQESALGIFNKGDKRFSSGARRAWLNILADNAKELFGIELKPEEGHKELLMILPEASPTKDYRIKVTEVTEAQLPPSEVEYKHLRLKRRSKDGPVYYNSNGQKVYSLTDLVLVNKGENTQHEFITDGGFISSEDMVDEVFNEGTNSQEKKSSLKTY